MTAVGTGKRLELLTLDGHTAIAAVSRAHVKGHLIYETDHDSPSL
jgi:hypothetical protein